MNASTGIDEISAALSHIPSHERETWVRMAMAVKSELGEAGFDIWDAWSQTASNYNPKAAKSVWKGIKAGGAVTIASLFHLAQEHGWQPSTAYVPPTPEQRATIEAERLAANEEAARIEAEQHTEVAKKSVNNWKKAGLVKADHPYIIAKGIKPFGAKQLRNSLVLPLLYAGALANLQWISADGAKKFHTGGKTKGCYHLIGEIKNATTVMMCEGWATGCTLHEATGLPVVVCFSAHNLVTVAKRMASVITCDVLVCGDNDHATEGNPGKVAAMKAANCFAGGRFILPTFTLDQIECFTTRHGKPPTDWNDLHQVEGLTAVQLAISQAAPTEQPTTPMEPEDIADFAKNAGADGAAGADGKNANNGGACEGTEGGPKSEYHSGADGAETGLPAGFLLKTTGEDAGLYSFDQDDHANKQKVCSPLKVLARTRDGEGKSWGRLLEFHDAEKRRHMFAVPASMTCGDGLELVRLLVDSGLEIVPGRKSQHKLTVYVMAARGNGFVRCTNRTGWHRDAFVLPNEVIAREEAERVFLQAERADSLGMTQAGSADEWREQVAMLASGNSRLLFAISLAFAAPLADIAGESGGFHFVGTSSTGKSTTQLLASSVWGHPDSFKVSWKATGNGLEGVCASRNDLLLVLDELAEFDGKSAGEVAYMIANGQGKTRSTRDGTARTPKRWRVLFLSSGEIPLSQHMAESGKQIRAGQEVRMVDIKADAGCGLGIFDTLTGNEETGSTLSDRVMAESARYYGTAGRAFLRKIIGESRGELAEVIKAAKAEFTEKAAVNSPDGQVMRVIGRFALVAAAGELATSYGLTGWQEGEAWNAGLRLFSEWLVARGGGGNSEAVRGVEAVRMFLESHGESRFTHWEADDETLQRTTQNRAGFRKKEGSAQWFYVFSGAYKKELCKGFDHKLITDVLIGSGMLEPGYEIEKNGAVKHDPKRPLPGMGRKRCYLITPVIWDAEP